MHTTLQKIRFLCLVSVMAGQLLTAGANDSASESRFFGPADSPISAAVATPSGRAWFLSSGTVPPVVDQSAPPGSPARYGDTKTQGVGALKQIEARLKEAGLSLHDVVFLRVYITADKSKAGKFDYPGWFEAYGQCFGTPENPVKPARSTMGVASLVNPDWLIEIEAVAIYPTPKAEIMPLSNSANDSGADPKR